jgi:integrase
MMRIARPRRPRPEDVDVVIVTPADVERMLRATADWQEFLCLSVLAYLGPRRDSVSRLRWRDVDLGEGTIRFREKGKKISVKPDAKRALADPAGGGRLCGDQLRPRRLRHPESKAGQRSASGAFEQDHLGDGKDSWRASRCASDDSCSRRAFAVAFLTSHPGTVESLQALLNHSRIDTTQVYLRALNRSKAMEPVRDFSWGLGFQAEVEEAHTGFEPVLPP